MAAAGATIGVDIGGTRVRVGKRDGRGGVHAARALVPAEGTALAAMIIEMAERIAPEGIARIGVSAPGPLDFAAGIVNKLGKPGWHGYPLIPELARRLGAPVLMDNDANCAALGEWREGAGAGSRTLVYFTLSTGVGTGVVIDGRVHHGAHDTEGGHQIVWPDGPECPCGGRGCLEAVASGTAIAARYGRPAEEIDDPAVWEEVAKYVAVAVASTTALLCPEVIVFGGGVSAQGERLFGPVRRKAAELIRILPVPTIATAGLGQDSGLVGALVLAETMPEGD
jgi:predicted NBD/HSP70 family sugar kinase